jgi:hypothetical protein
MVGTDARRRAGGWERARYGRLAAASAMSLALTACASAHSTSRQSTGPPDCSTKFAMSAAPATVRPGDLVALSDNAPAARASGAELGDPGTLGTVSHGQYTPLWNLGPSDRVNLAATGLSAIRSRASASIISSSRSGCRRCSPVAT